VVESSFLVQVVCIRKIFVLIAVDRSYEASFLYYLEAKVKYIQQGLYVVVSKNLYITNNYLVDHIKILTAREYAI
jgi:hypothetical protein